MTRFFTIVAALALVAAGCLWLHEQSRPAVRATQPIRREAASLSIHAPGIVEGGRREVELRPEVPGRIAEILVAEGDYVEAGQLLVKLDDATQRHSVTMLEAEVRLAQAQLERLKNGAHEYEREEAKATYAAAVARRNHAQLELKRAERLQSANAISDQEYDRWDNEVRSLTQQAAAAKARVDFLTAPARTDELLAAEAKVDIAQARLNLARAELARTEVLAPSRGQVLHRRREPGEVVDLEDPRPVLVMADTFRPRVRAYVEELDAPHVRMGLAAHITADGFPGRVFVGEVVEVLPSMSAKQVWSERPSERFDLKTREVVIELRGEVDQISGRPVSWASSNSSNHLTSSTASRAAYTGPRRVGYAHQGEEADGDSPDLIDASSPANPYRAAGDASNGDLASDIDETSEAAAAIASAATESEPVESAPIEPDDLTPNFTPLAQLGLVHGLLVEVEILPPAAPLVDALTRRN
ncbi:MAG: HlyD family efflux transporter periplasmic adaptor subunit [Pirellulaceae bacterium]|nr:HlyD family efflux transporter periplasmic adaptor subunit [Pirellulaceae bacterium]